ncbi:MAG: SagB/ThcOx family dehydrogenase [Prevotellaceae bacterium]|jgi:SagB-type dehydrogenase family enzyme|nr:SagB/ThcOx family dehydrogenase [Prevotellaceae bacterium]
MKRYVLTLVAFFAASFLNAQDMKPIELKSPDMGRKATMMDAFQKRASSLEWTDAKLSVQHLSDLLWAANGINRPAESKRTAPSAINAQDVDIYVFLEEGAYLYDAKANILHPIAKGDFRAEAVAPRPGSVISSSQPPVLLVLVSDISRFARVSDEGRKLTMAAMDAGIVSQNIAIFCAGADMVTRPRMSMDTAKIKEVLKLSDTQHPLLNNPIGYAKK